MTTLVRMSDVLIIEMLMSPSASVRNIFAATPELTFMPAPMIETFAMLSATISSRAPRSSTILRMTSSVRAASALGEVNEISV